MKRWTVGATALLFLFTYATLGVGTALAEGGANAGTAKDANKTNVADQQGGKMANAGSKGEVKSVEDKAVDEIQAFIDKSKIDENAKDWKLHLPKPPKATFDPQHTYFWNMETNKGTMKIEFMPSVAPMHVSSTMYLTMLGFYDGLTFHRVIPGFMAQGGDPTGTGRSGPGYQYFGEFDPAAKHDGRGILSMAHAGPGTDGSQFFITFAPTPHLDGKHTVFGRVVEGMDTLAKLEAAGSRSGATTEPLVIEHCTISVE